MYLLFFVGITERIGHHAAAFVHIVLRSVQMPMQPQRGMRQQIIQCIAKTGRARYAPIARISAV